MTGELSQREEDKTLLGHLRRSNRNINLKLRSLFLFLSFPYSIIGLAYCTPTNSVGQDQGDITYCTGNAAVSSATKASAIHSFLHFCCFTLCRDISAQFSLICFCSNIPPCSGTFKCLLGHHCLKVNHDYVVQNFRVLLSYSLPTSYNRLINPPGSH